MSIIPDQAYHMGGVPVGSLQTFDMGNVYYACASTDTNYATDFIQSKQGTYANDGTQRLYTDIQSALNACTSQRNDYVILLSNFTDTAALTMSKSRVHLLSPQGIMDGWVGDRSITQSTASTDCITITGHGNEVAGIWFNGKQGADIIDIDSTWITHIHHNYFAMSATASSNNYGIVGTAPVQPSIHHNLFCNHSPAAMSGTDNDIAAFIGITGGGATRGYICDNSLTTYLNTAVAVGIQWAGCECFIARNLLLESKAHGVSEAGTFTLGISTAGDNIVVDNRIGIATAANAVSGGTADQSYVENYESASGGTVAT